VAFFFRLKRKNLISSTFVTYFSEPSLTLCPHAVNFIRAHDIYVDLPFKSEIPFSRFSLKAEFLGLSNGFCSFHVDSF
jgi:hypothetical protein